MDIDWVPQGDSGTIATGVEPIVGTVADIGLSILFADFNGDGRVDYAFVDPDTSAVTLWLNRCSNPVEKK
jgi:hypothetical protein